MLFGNGSATDYRSRSGTDDPCRMLHVSGWRRREDSSCGRPIDGSGPLIPATIAASRRGEWTIGGGMPNRPVTGQVGTTMIGRLMPPAARTRMIMAPEHQM